MATTFMIIDNRELRDGEMMARDRLFETLPYCPAGVKVLAFDLDEALDGYAPTVREVTEDVVWEAYRGGAFAGFENARDGIAGEFIDFPMSREDAAERMGAF